MGSSSDSAITSSAIEVVVQEEELLADLEAKQGGGLWLLLLLGVNKAFETWRAEALHDLERNSIGALGLSGKWVLSGRREHFRGKVSSMEVVSE